MHLSGVRMTRRSSRPDDGPQAHDVAIELGRLMLLGANEFLPDVPARVEPLLARCWSKKSKPVYSNGRLVPWAA